MTKELTNSSESFYFTLNGKIIWSKGSNLVPLHAFESGVTKQVIDRIIWSAKEANLNTLRVWGGGRYLSKEFYDACDEVGIIIWQEFMFACGTYPTDLSFIKEVAEEVLQQAIRLSEHASVGLFGFNNENEDSFEWFDETIENSKLYATDYVHLFIDVVRWVFLEVLPTTSYVDTSPSNGIYKNRDIYTKRWGPVSDTNYGDIHIYGYDSNLFKDEFYPKAKFVSEFGFMSFPSFAAYSKTVDRQSLDDPLPMIKYRTRKMDGIDKITNQFMTHFAIQKCVRGIAKSNRAVPTWDNFQDFIYLSQLQQGLIYRQAASVWRQQVAPNNTMGFLYWQLNDVWAGPSWSTLNVDGSWKLSHNLVKGFFAPITYFVRRHIDSGTISVYVSNHLTHEVLVRVTVTLIPYRGSSESAVWTVFDDGSVKVPAWGYISVVSFNLKDMGIELNKNFIQVSLSKSGDNQESTGFNPMKQEFLMTEAKDAQFAHSQENIEVQVDDISLGTHTNCPNKNYSPITIRLHAQGGPALYTALESQDNVIFLDNAVTVLPWEELDISACLGPNQNVQHLKDRIRITWLQKAMWHVFCKAVPDKHLITSAKDIHSH